MTILKNNFHRTENLLVFPNLTLFKSNKTAILFFTPGLLVGPRSHRLHYFLSASFPQRTVFFPSFIWWIALFIFSCSKFLHFFHFDRCLLSSSFSRICLLGLIVVPMAFWFQISSRPTLAFALIFLLTRPWFHRRGWRVRGLSWHS